MILPMILLFAIGGCACLPLNSAKDQKLEDDVRSLLDTYYQEEIANDIASSLEEMQSDQPTIPTEINLADDPTSSRRSRIPTTSKVPDPDYIRRRNRARDLWKEHIMLNILRQVGRVNSTIPDNVDLDKINIKKVIHNFQNTSNVRLTDDSFITEKIRSFYPSCDVPKNTDQELWKEDNEMNLFFDFEQMEGTIATATLRLYRTVVQNGTAATTFESNNCDRSHEDDKLYRVSIFFYTKSLRKHRIKRRLCDSKVITDQSKWVELNVRPAARSWSKGKNLGLAVLVEDQDGGIMRAEAFFKGAACMVGSSTPKPIPTVLLDSARSNELLGVDRFDGGNSTAAPNLGSPMLPTIDICTLEVAENQSGQLDLRACNLRLMQEDQQKAREREIADKVAGSLTMPPARHIRHHRQHLADRKRQAEDPNDPRSRIVQQQVILTSEQLQNYNLNDFNLTSINR